MPGNVTMLDSGHPHCYALLMLFGSLLPTDKLVIQSFLQDSRGELATEQSAVLDFRVAAQELLLTVPPRYDPSSSPLTGLACQPTMSHEPHTRDEQINSDLKFYAGCPSYHSPLR